MKTNHFFLPLAVAALLLLFHAPLCAQDVRQVGPFEEITLSGKMDVLLEKGDTEQIIIENRAANPDDLNISLRGRGLRLSLVDGWVKGTDRMRIRVIYTDLRYIRVMAGATLDSDSTLVAKDLEIRAGSGAEVRLTISAEDLTASAQEGAVLRLTGTAQSQYAIATTGGIYHGMDLATEDTDVKANTGGEAHVAASKSLRASANTGGHVEYAGNPEERYISKSLGGEIRSF